MTHATSPLVWLAPAPPVMTPSEARAYALDLIGQADEADGGQTLSSFVTRADVIDALLAAREALARLSIDL